MAYISIAADLYLDEEKPDGVACVTGMPEHPVYFWTAESGWDRDPHGRQSADVSRYPRAAAMTYAYGDGAPEDGDTIDYIDGDSDSLTIRSYRYRGEDEDGDPIWRETERREIDLRAWVIERIRARLDDELIEAASDLGIMEI